MILAMLLALSAATIDEQVVELVPGYTSAVSVADIAAKDGVRLIEETDDHERDRPRFHHRIYSLENTVFCASAEIRFEFFNDELMQIDVYPRSAEGLTLVRRGMAKLHGVNAKKLSDGIEVNGLRLKEADDAWGRTYISVSSTQVLERFKSWIDRYS